MITRILLFIIGLANLINGAFMLVAPGVWYAVVPGVAETGPLNPHFVYDIGMAFIASGAFMMAGARTGRTGAVLAFAGATWPVLHALIHVRGWLMNGFPSDTHAAMSEVVGVVVLSVLGAVLAWLRLKGER